jgi:ribonuclease HI
LIDFYAKQHALTARHHTSWKWVAGHSGHPENKRADALARAAIVRIWEK